MVLVVKGFDPVMLTNIWRHTSRKTNNEKLNCNHYSSQNANCNGVGRYLTPQNVFTTLKQKQETANWNLAQNLLWLRSAYILYIRSFLARSMINGQIVCLHWWKRVKSCKKKVKSVSKELASCWKKKAKEMQYVIFYDHVHHASSPNYADKECYSKTFQSIPKQSVLGSW